MSANEKPKNTTKYEWNEISAAKKRQLAAKEAAKGKFMVDNRNVNNSRFLYSY